MARTIGEVNSTRDNSLEINGSKIWIAEPRTYVWVSSYERPAGATPENMCPRADAKPLSSPVVFVHDACCDNRTCRICGEEQEVYLEGYLPSGS